MASFVPGDHGGYSQAGELEERPFASSNPRSPAPRSRIVAVCGPNDWADPKKPSRRHNAAPENDGWFISDFYMLHHLLKDVSNDQFWLTCLDPKRLVEKYEMYAQGSPKSNERRIVLDKDVLPSLNITVVDPRRLLAVFLEYVKQQSIIAAENNQTLILVILGHGEKGTFRIVIGGTSDQSIALRRENRLDQRMLHDVLNKEARVSMITTSCYSGGWTVSPHFNMNTMAAVSMEMESLSEPSATLGRLCGSRYITAFSQALIETTIPDLVVGDDGELPPTSPTYNALTKAVFDTFRSGIGDFDPGFPTFSARDDKWQQIFNQSGLTSVDYQARWMALKKILATSGAGIAVGGSVFRRNLTPTAAQRLLISKAITYRNSYPGFPNSAKNIAVENMCSRVLNPQIRLDEEEIEHIDQVLSYRLFDIMYRASAYKEALGLPFAECEEWNAEQWTSRLNIKQQDRLFKISDLVEDKDLFDAPLVGEGWRYTKGEKYLSAIIYDAGWSHKETEKRLSDLKRNYGTVWSKRQNMLNLLTRTPSIREVLRDVAQRTGRRMRSLSPVKRQSGSPSKRTSLESRDKRKSLTESLLSLKLKPSHDLLFK